MESKKIIMMPLEDIKPYENNPRNNESAVEMVAQSIKDFGFKNPIIVDKDNVIIAGHTRLKAAYKLSLKTAPVIIADDLDEDKVKAFRLVDNRTAEVAAWDFVKLEEELANIEMPMEAFDFNFEAMGFEAEEEEPKEIEEDDVPEVDDENEPTTKLGDIWQLGDHRLMCGDSTDKATVELLMNGNKADMVFTDPPYGISVVGDNGKVGADNLAKNGVYMPVKGDETTETTKRFFEVCKELGFDKYIIWGGNYFVGFLPYSDGWVIWDKRGDMASNNFADGEMAWCSFHTPVRIYKQVWSGMIREGEREKRVHPTQKPVRLLAEILTDFTNNNDVILDCFGGSGSTLIACEQIDRQCYMIEYEPHYCEVIIKRWETLTGKKAVLLNG